MRSPRPVIAVLIAVLIALAGCTSSGSGPLETAAPTGSGSASGPRSASGTESASGSGSASGSATVAAGSSDVSFVVDGTTTYGTLDVPAHRADQRLAAALLIPGSGPVDRDGNVPSAGATPNTLKVIADILEKRGIMTLRFDKYFTGKTGPGRYADDPASATIQGDLRQADAAYEYLSRQPQADPARLLVVGHSEGGMIALNIAATTSATKPAGLALLEPQDRRILNLIFVQTDEEIDALVAQGQLPAAQARPNAAAAARAIMAFRAGQQVSTDGLAPQVAQFLAPEILTSSAEHYVRTWDAIVPAALAADVKDGTRVLVTEGTHDTKVPPNTIHPLVQALSSAGVTGPGLQLIQGTDHDMHLASQPANQAVLAPAVVSAIQQWAQRFASSH